MLRTYLSVSFSRFLQKAFLITVSVHASWYSVKALSINPGDTVKGLRQAIWQNKASMDSLNKAKKLAAFRAVDDFVKVKLKKILLTLVYFNCRPNFYIALSCVIEEVSRELCAFFKK